VDGFATFPICPEHEAMRSKRTPSLIGATIAVRRGGSPSWTLPGESESRDLFVDPFIYQRPEQWKSGPRLSPGNAYDGQATAGRERL